MKKAFALLLAALLLVSLSACVLDSTGNEEPKVPYVPSDKATVASSYMVNGTAKFIISLSDGADVKDVGVACMYFDENGKLLSEYETISCSVSGEKRTSWETSAPANCLYVVATVAYTIDSSIQKVECKGLDTWAKETEENFTVAGHKKQMEAWAQEGAKAETCEYVKIDSLTVTDGVLEVGLTNLKTQDFPQVHVYLLLYDENGYPIDGGGKTCPNCKLVNLPNLRSEETATYTYTVPAGTVSAKCIISAVKNDEATLWSNEHQFDWLYSNYATAPAAN